jgi:alkaline phosphatase D
LANNPHVKYCKGERGYVRVTTTAAQTRADFMTTSDTSVYDPAAVVIKNDRSYVVQAGKPGLLQV